MFTKTPAVSLGIFFRSEDFISGVENIMRSTYRVLTLTVHLGVYHTIIISNYKILPSKSTLIYYNTTTGNILKYIF